MSKRFGKFAFGKRFFGGSISAFASGGSGSGGTGSGGTGGGGAGSGSGNYNPPTANNIYQFQVEGSGFEAGAGHYIDIWHNRELAGGDSYNVFLDGAQHVTGQTNGSFRIYGVLPGQTYDIQIGIVVGGLQVEGSNTIKATVARTLGDQWFQITGFSATDPATVGGAVKNLRWSYVVNKMGGTGYLGSYIMIRRYDTEDLVGIDAEKIASKDINGTMGYEVLAPTNTGHPQPELGDFDWLVPVGDGAIYRAFLMGENSAGLGSHWHPGPIFRTGESYQPGADILPLWSTADAGTGTVTHIRNGVRTLMANWITAVEACTQAGDELEVNGVVRTTSATADIRCKASGTRENPIRVFGLNGPDVDSVRSARVLDGVWSSEGGGKFSTPIPADYIISGLPNYKINSIWVGDLPLRQAGRPSRDADLDKSVLGYGNWTNTLLGMDSSNMEEQTFYWDGTNGKIWVHLPGGLDPSPYVVEAAYGTGCISGIDKVSGQDVLRNYWTLENITWAHCNYSALFGGRQGVVETGRIGWQIRNCAILGSDYRGLGHYSTESLVDNCVIDGAQAIGMIQQNTGPELGWVGDSAHPNMYSLMQNVSFSALNVGQYFPANHLGLKRIPAQSHWHERRTYVGPRVSNTFPGFYLKNMGMGAWYDLPGRNNIHEECFFEDLAFGVYTEIGPKEWQTSPGAWGVDNRNIVDVGFNDFFYINDSPTNDSISLRTFLSSTNKGLVGHCTTLGATCCLFIGGGQRTIQEPNFFATTTAEDCAAHGNMFQVRPDAWGNVHVHSPGVDSFNSSVDDNYHVDAWSGSIGFYKGTNQADLTQYGLCLRDAVGTPNFLDVANKDYRVSGGTANAQKYGASVPAPRPIRYS